MDSICTTVTLYPGHTVIYSSLHVSFQFNHSIPLHRPTTVLLVVPVITPINFTMYYGVCHGSFRSHHMSAWFLFDRVSTSSLNGKADVGKHNNQITNTDRSGYKTHCSSIECTYKESNSHRLNGSEIYPTKIGIEHLNRNGVCLIAGSDPSILLK